MGKYFIGLISGTSMDGIDAALVRFGESTVELVQTHEHAYPTALRQQLAAATLDPSIRSFDDVAELHRHVGECFRDAANTLLDTARIDASEVAAIGSHGQTIRHEPNADSPYSLQIGDAHIIARGAGIKTVADFRSADIELGGQGAPLTPAFHEWLLRDTDALRIVLNIGGIANVTILPPGDDDTMGFDTGPGNTLLDMWISKHRDLPFDQDGEWSISGTVDPDLLRRLLSDDYFVQKPPKSTGFEYFNLRWLEEFGVAGTDPADVQATLCALTATSIADAIASFTSDPCEILVCGGGIHNEALMQRLHAQLADYNISSTATAGLDPDWVEAAAFAWLARRRLENLPGNLPAVTGASRPAVLGTVTKVRTP